MNGLARFSVSSVETGSKALDYFNGFHDGFMKRIVLVSQDQINEDQSQTCTGTFDVEIDFAHYNYARGAEPFHPHNQVVHAEFRNVRNIIADFRDGFLGNTILNLSITSATQKGAGQAVEEPCLGLRLTRHYYVERERRYELHETQLFTFASATFAEQPTGPG
jgi:hypothetical protein